MSATDDPTDPRLTRGVDETPRDQAAAYLVLSEQERAAGFVRPVRQSYLHLTCGAVTTMGLAIAETYARQPSFYGATYCVGFLPPIILGLEDPADIVTLVRDAAVGAAQAAAS